MRCTACNTEPERYWGLLEDDLGPLADDGRAWVLLTVVCLCMRFHATTLWTRPVLVDEVEWLELHDSPEIARGPNYVPSNAVDALRMREKVSAGVAR